MALKWRVLLAAVAGLFGGQHASPVEFYVGAAAQCGFGKHVVASGGEAYWNKCIYRNFQKTLETLSARGQGSSAGIQTGAEQYRNQGGLGPAFVLCQQVIPAQLYDKTHQRGMGMAAIGAYIYRHKHVLVACEAYGAYASLDVARKQDHVVFKGDVPTALQPYADAAVPGGGDISVPYEVGIDPSVDSEEQNARYAYFDGEIAVEQEFALEQHYFVGLTLRTGALAGERAFVFLCVGPELAFSKIRVKDLAVHGADKLTLLRFSASQTYNATTTWSKVALPGESDLANALTTFDQKICSAGVTVGLGTDFFCSRHLVLRPQVTYSYYPERQIAGQSGSCIKYKMRMWRISLGVFWRF